MKIYNYHPITKEYLSENIADESPIEEGVNLIPANASTIQPPIVQDNKVAIFENGEWIIKPDFRGQKVYAKSDLSVFTIDFIGDIPDQYLTELPAKPGKYFIWNGTEYVFSIDTVRTERNRLLAECDFTQLSDSPLAEELREKYRIYRQELRDFPAKCNPNNPVWPDKPQ